MAEWYTLWGQEFSPNCNLLLVSGPHRLHQKMIEKKGDLVIDCSLLHRACMREGVKQLVVFVCQFLCLSVCQSGEILNINRVK